MSIVQPLAMSQFEWTCPGCGGYIQEVTDVGPHHDLRDPAAEGQPAVQQGAGLVHEDTCTILAELAKQVHQ